MLNLIVLLVDQVKRIHLDYVLSYLLRMVKCNTMFFEKLSSNEGKAIFPDLNRRINEYAVEIVREYAKLVQVVTV